MWCADKIAYQAAPQLCSCGAVFMQISQTFNFEYGLTVFDSLHCIDVEICEHINCYTSNTVKVFFLKMINFASEA
jgi:hypothetical protein